ncbi:uncharacterized protein LOC132260421 isoform X2 [Phlebotomus argentipes]|uniref:uncharacterized protein LOC132260421 isoform X2 n=1 Tax=Phlebotomus argentipes TaxID=94469 RepID=UPI002892D354|nr:uncharacterized protein LOC132260421 isoform X2 [Phlebotomus argentipes]
MGSIRRAGVIEGLMVLSILLSVAVLSAPVTPEFESGTILDLNNPDPNILRQYNINITTIRNRQAALKNRNTFMTPPSSIRNNESFLHSSPSSTTINQRRIFEEKALESIRETIFRNILRNDTRPGGNEPISHDVAAYSLCQAPRNTNETFWNEGNSYNLYFEPPQMSANMNLSAATLRLYKIETPVSERRNQTRQANDCGHVDELLRITVSAYVKKHRKAERKKRIYSSTMVDKSFVGWVELDVRQAVKLWEKPNKNLGLAIDVHDQDENSLRASQFFFQHSCEASPYPWTFLRKSAWPYSSMEKVPRHPRIDFKFCSKPLSESSEFPPWSHHHSRSSSSDSSPQDALEEDDNGCIHRKKRRHIHHNHSRTHA